MRFNSHKGLFEFVSKILIIFMLIGCAMFFSACTTNYSQTRIVLSLSEKHITLYINDDVSTTESINIQVVTNLNMSKQVNVSTENNKLKLETTFNSDETTTLTISASGVFKNAMVTVTTKEGQKSTVFYVSAEIAVTSISETPNVANLYAIKGQTTELDPSKLLSVEPANATEKDIKFTLYNPNEPNVHITEEAPYNLTIGENYAESTIKLLATLVKDDKKYAIITLDVIKPLGNNITYSAFYTNTPEEVDLTSLIKIARNIPAKNHIVLDVLIRNLQVNGGIRDVLISPYMESSQSSISDYLGVSSSEKTIGSDFIKYSFTINAENLNGLESLYFNISYAGYEYTFKTQSFNFEVYDAVSNIAVLVDDDPQENLPSYDFVVYDKYYTTYGLKINSSVYPSTVPQSDKLLVLRLGISAMEYFFLDKYGNEIVFNNGTYEFESGENIYVKAKTSTSNNASFTIYSKSNPEIEKQFNVSAQIGATDLHFTNAISVNNLAYYYLTSNEAMEKRIEFSANNAQLNDIRVIINGNSFEKVGNVLQGTTVDSFYFFISSIKGALDDNKGSITIILGNGLSTAAKVEVFTELEQDKISLTIPSSQYNASIGHKSLLTNKVINGINYNLEFSVALQNGESIPLSVKANSKVSIEYKYFDFALVGSAYDPIYQDFNNFSASNGNISDENYLATSSIIRSIYLISSSQIYASSVGKVWVKAQIKGYALIDNIKTACSHDFYFLVEVYNPIKLFSLSKTSLTLYSLNSVGDSHVDYTFEQLSVLLNQNATYNKIEWSNKYTSIPSGESSMSFYVNNEQIFTFTDNKDSVLVEAFSTLYEYNNQGEAVFEYANALEFQFIAKVTEFGKTITISLKVTIKKAEQVKKIVVDNLNVESGIYMELDYKGNDLFYPIKARVDNGASNRPLNDKLIFEFEPDTGTSSSLLSIDKNTGLITIKGDVTQGGTGRIRIAPADRYINNIYVPDENDDVAVYISITVADGRSRVTSYRITSLNDIVNSQLHYTLMNNIEINSANPYGVFEIFSGGLYGCVEGTSFISTITTNKTLFNTLTNSATIQDLIIRGNISSSYSGFIAEINEGLIKNVTVDTLAFAGVYSPSSLTVVTDFEYVGGLVGVNNGTIQGSNFYGKIFAPTATTGGIAGQNNGDVSHCTVEFYNYTNEYAILSGGQYIGGLVGEMTSGSLTYSYAYSYVKDGENYMNLNVLRGTIRGGLVGLLSGGYIDICFAYINDLLDLIGEVDNQDEPVINNAYIIYNTSNTILNANYIYYENVGYDYNLISTDALWVRATIGINKGFPYFKDILQNDTVTDISSTLNENLENMISVDGTSIIFFFESNLTLTKQEQSAINALNTLSFSTLLGVEDVSGIRAVSSNSSIVGAFSNGIVLYGTGTVNLTIFSKYDYSISKEFTIYVIYPTLSLKLTYDNFEFGNGAVINNKINQSLVIHGSVANTKMLVNRDVLINTNNLNILFNSYYSYVQGSGMGGFVFDTQQLYNDTLLTEALIDYTVILKNLPSGYISDNKVIDLAGINAILFDYFNSQFTIKLYKGADDIILSSSGVAIEPSDTYSFDAYVFSDIDYSAEEMAISEGIALDIFKSQTETFEILNTELSQDKKILTYYIGENSNVMFVVRAEYLTTVYYLSTTDRTQQTLNPSLAVYYQHQFKITINIADSFKNYNFDNTEYNILIYALTSKLNSENYHSNLIAKDFNLTVKSQTVLSVDATHYELSEKVLRYIEEEQQNKMFYKYKEQSSSVLNPGNEGLLAIGLYPVYANYEYLTVTYQANVSGDYELRLALMDNQVDGSFIKNSAGFTKLVNGIRIDNTYTYDEFNTASLTNLYLSTYVSANIDKNVVFVITITAYNNAGDQVGVSVDFNIIVQYLSGAKISVQDENQNELQMMARGETEYLVIVVNLEQNLGSINIKGRLDTPDINNFITYSSFTETVDLVKGTKTYKTSLYVGTGLLLENESNYFIIEVTISWLANGKIQTKTTSLNMGVVDFIVSSIALKTDKLNTNIFNGYIGIQSTLMFDFIVKDFISQSAMENPSLSQFINNAYYKNKSGVNAFGDYIVNYGNEGVGSFIGNLYYISGGSYLQVLNSDGTFAPAPNGSFTFLVDENGAIKVVGQRSGSMAMMFTLPVKTPSFNQNLIHNIEFYFTINIEVYSDEDTPLIIDNETAFYNALAGENPQNYILMSDLYLTDYAPSNTTGISSLDGNNFVIHIMNWNLDADTGNTLRLALFNNVTEKTTLKNIIVNTYHASSILVDTTKYNNIEVAGLAIRNEGIIYNCHIVAFEADTSKPDLLVPAGLNISYSIGQINESKTSRLAGFVLDNNGSITNSRVGGESLEFAVHGIKFLNPFNLSAQGNIAGFVYNNTGSIASSYFANGTLTNYTSSGIVTFTAGFAGINSGSIQISYVKGVGEDGFSLSNAGISTASVSAGFVHTNKGNIGDCYSNILLTTTNASTKMQHASGRLTSGFVYNNQEGGNIERCYTASKIEEAKTTQMNFVGVNDVNEMQNAGTIKNSYYYNIASDLDDAYASADENISVKRVTEPDLKVNFYGLTFADSASMLNGVWYITSSGPELVSANQIAVSSRFMANEVRDEITGELIEYALPYHENYEYGSILNPIIIRDAFEFNRVFGGDHDNAGTAIPSYYDLTAKKVFGNYRILTNIDLSDLITDGINGVKINSSNMVLTGGVLDGNMFTIEGLELVANIDATGKNYGMFASLENNAIIMNLQIGVIEVSAVAMQNVGAVAGTVDSSKLVNLSLYSGKTGESAIVMGNNIVGGVVGKIVGDSEVKNIQTNNINVLANHMSTGTSQRFNREETAVNKVNSNVSYAGGIAGVADIYKENKKYNLNHDDRMTEPQLAFLTVKGNMRISGSSVGGIFAFLGPQSLMQDVTFELAGEKNQKLIAYNFSAGGVVGECYGDINMARTQHEYALQTTIENNVSRYYLNPSISTIERGNLSLFEHENMGQYSPKNIGGLVGELKTGNISHSYSKLAVRNSSAIFAGGIVGAITYAENNIINNINFYEVYTFSDVFASGGVGGIAGYIDQNRTLYFDKVNAVNYWTLHKDETNNTYYLPDSYYDIYAMTGTNNLIPQYVGDIVQDNGGDNITIKGQFSSYNLPVISHEIHSEDVYAMNNVKFDYAGTTTTLSVKMSYASLGSSYYFKFIDENVQTIIPLYEYKNAQESGSLMDTYFRNSGWDPNFWKRYRTDMLPRLISSAELNIFYIYVAEDLLNMIYYPTATFIVVGKDGNGIVKAGNYIVNTGFSLNNFSGVLKGYDNSGDYGFDFENYSLTFINSTLSGAKIYNLTLKNLGGDQYQSGVGSLVGASMDTEFENLNFEDCRLYSYANKNNYNVGLLCGHINAGHISNISFEDCAVNVIVDEDLTELNVGLMAGLISTPTNKQMQIADITAYISTGNLNSSPYTNRINVNVNSHQITNLNSGTIAGSVDGAVFLNYTSKTVTEQRTKSLGVSDTASNVFPPDSVYNNNYYGVVLDVTGSGTITGEYNAGIAFGRANVLNLAYLRSALLKVVGAIISSGSVEVNKAVLGGYVGKSLTSSVITNGSGTFGNYMFVDCDIRFTAGSTTAGMLIGEASVISALENVDTYGTINVTSKNTASYIGGIVGKVNSDLDLRFCISRTAIDFNEEAGADSSSAIGGFIGLVNTRDSIICIGEDSLSSKYFGTITINASDVYVGGIIGAFSAGKAPNEDRARTEIRGAVFGGKIIINETEQAYVGGIVGATNYQDQDNEAKKTIEDCFVYGNIYVYEDFADNTLDTYIGGVLGKGSPNTAVNSNYCMTTIYTKYTQTENKITVNAIVGEANGSFTETLTGSPLTNYYSHQLSLCLDCSGILAENVYYYTQSSGSTTILNDIMVRFYIAQLGRDQEKEAYLGSKLNPFMINSSTYTEYLQYFGSENDFFTEYPNAEIKYFVITDDMSSSMTGIYLYRSFVVGDGFSVTTQTKAIFSMIDEASTVTGIAIKAQIKTNDTTTYTNEGSTYYSGGTLADVNNGFVYSCNANEMYSAKMHGMYGIVNNSGGAYIGGLIGINTGYISDCYAYMDIASANVVGGLVGLNMGSISHSYSNGSVVSSNSNAYSFANNTGSGSIYYCYTVSATYNGNINLSYQVTLGDSISTSPFGSAKIVGCYYDVFAVSSSSEGDGIIKGITDEMAVYDYNNILAKTSANDYDSETGITTPKIFLTNPNKVDDKNTKVKFGYDYTVNNGYLTFIGEAYESLDYMKDCYTGNGLSEYSAIEIPNVGKFQQLNDALPVYHYALVRDIVCTDEMKESNADEDITSWKAIGEDSKLFRGSVTGNYSTYSETNLSYKIIGLSMSDAENYCSVFGSVLGAKLNYLEIEARDDTTNALYSAGLVGKAESAIINNIILSDVKITYNASSQVYMGGLAGQIIGGGSGTIIEDCTINAVTIEYGTSSSGSNSYIGGLAGKISDDVRISNCLIDGAVKLNYNAAGGGCVGGIVGDSTGSSSNYSILENVSISGNVSIENTYSSSSSNTDYFGAIAGKTAFTDISAVSITGGTNTFTNNMGVCYMGGWIGLAGDETIVGFGSNTVSGATIFKVDSSNSNKLPSYIGGLFGKISVLDVSSCAMPSVSFDYKSTNCKPYIGGFAGIIDNSRISNISASFSAGQIVCKTNSSAYIGGLAAEISGTSTVSSVSVSFAEGAVELQNEMDEIYIAGLTALSSGNLTATGCNMSEFNVTDLSVKNGAIGGAIATAMGQIRLTNCSISNSEFELDATGEVNLGGVVGKITSSGTAGSTLTTCNSDRLKLSVSGGTDVNLGGIIGSFNATGTDGALLKTCNSIRVGLTADGGNSANLGGIIGTANGKIDIDECLLNGNQDFNSEGTNLNFKSGGTSSTGNIGGLIGRAIGASENPISIINNTKVKDNIKLNAEETNGSVYMGGLIGQGDNVSIGQGISAFRVFAVYQDSGKIYMGGIIGKAHNSTVSEDTGGNNITVQDSVFMVAGEDGSTVNAEGYVGGLIGWIDASSTLKNATLLNCKVINGAMGGNEENSGACGGIVGFASGGNVNLEKVKTEGSSLVVGYKKAGGILGAGIANITNATTNGEIFAGYETENCDLDALGLKTFSFKYNDVPYAGGIASRLNSGIITSCKNYASVKAGNYGQSFSFGNESNPRTLYGGMASMINWGLYHSEELIDEGSSESYAGGIVGYSASPVSINNSSNYGFIEAFAQEVMVTQLAYEETHGWFDTFGEHHVFITYYKERAYANGISYIENGASLTQCFNSGTVNGGQEVGFNFVHNTPYPFMGGEKFYIMHYGKRNGQDFNAIFYMYGWNTDIRNDILNAGVIVGMHVHTIIGSDSYLTFPRNLYYGNQICNNPTISIYQDSIGGHSFKYLNSYSYYGNVTDCVYNGGTGSMLFPAKFIDEPRVHPEAFGEYSNDYVDIIWEEYKINNEYLFGASQGAVDPNA